MSAGATRTTTATQRPTRVASGLAVCIALFALWKLGASSLSLALELLGVAAFAAGVGLWRRDWLVSGSVIGFVGVAGFAGSLGVAFAAITKLSGFIRLIPGLIGVIVLALALVPAHGTGSRALVKVGTALVFIGVLASGIFNAVTLGTLLLAGAATVVAWDAGEHAINVGEHLGRGQDTREIELVHVAGTGVVALVAVEAATFSGGVGPSSLSLASLVLLLVAIVLLAVALHD